MLPSEILHLRLQNQQLLNPSFKKPEELVNWMGAVQAQDYAGAKWAVGLRTHPATDDRIEQAINDGKIIRTHVLRPTWHLVHPTDVRWMLALTAPRIHAFNAFGYRKMELTDTIFKRAHKTIINALQGGKQLTRTELAAALRQAKIATDDLRFIHLLMHAELHALVCNGARKGK
ncbi:MAG TPA: crosslink repair DNA glycosylase YcaQ family protein, partial [Cyclobacteriaceae bacterium]|nr:crosslink repair DNA glycosylase YcaQ family protein [Cyclobacteriaceae bacterium]